jgi:hypothetical protein
MIGITICGFLFGRGIKRQFPSLPSFEVAHFKHVRIFRIIQQVSLAQDICGKYIYILKLGMVIWRNQLESAGF